MAKFVNLKADSDKPLIMDAEIISVITEITEKSSEKDNGTILFNDAEQGQFLQVDPVSWELDADVIVDRMKEAGTDLVPIPYYWGDNREIGRFFVNPALVQSIIVSGEVEKDGDSEPHVGLLADVKGYGRVETYRVPVSVLNEFVAAVEAVNPHFIRFESKNIGSRWSGDGGFTMIDPTEVRDITPNGYDMDIKFKDGTRLDFHLDRGNKVSKAVNEYLNKLVNRIKGNGTLDDVFKAVGGNLNNLSPRLRKYEDKMRMRLREEFAAAITPHNPDLTKIENAQGLYYTTLDHVSWINARDNYIAITFKRAAGGDRYNNDIVARFDSDDKAKAEMKRLLTLINQPKP